ncbi:MAG: carbohydrate ABC transporter permease [Thermoflexales bacterium]|nr:carbohydrate ABC transporter permease [Thermoflexales bacterium]
MISKRFRPLLYLVLVVAAGLYLIPVYVLVVTGLKSFAQVDLDTMWALPSSFSPQSFVRAWSGDPARGQPGLSRNFFNSVALVVPATVFSALLGSMNGYVLSKWRFRGSDTFFTLFLFGMFIPYQSILIPLVQTLQGLNLYGTLAGLILVHVVYGIPITTLIFRNYYAAVPTEMVEAGRIDGANLLDVYRYIMFPISLPGFVVVTIWQFTSIWNEFLFAVTITSKPSVQPITVALNNLAGSFVVEWNVQMAGALMAALPTLLVYVVMGRYFMRGLLAGSVKG